MEYFDQTSWTKTEFNLEFLAFRFPTSGNLTAVCDLKICLEGDCATESTQSCWKEKELGQSAQKPNSFIIFIPAFYCTYEIKS